MNGSPIPGSRPWSSAAASGSPTRACSRRELAAGWRGRWRRRDAVVGLWVVHQPRESVGQLASLSDEVALGDDQRPAVGLVSRPDRHLRRSDVGHSGRAWSKCPSPALTSPMSSGRSGRRPKKRCRRQTKSSAMTSAPWRCSRCSPHLGTPRPRKPARASPQALRAAEAGDRPLPALLAGLAGRAKRSGTTSHGSSAYKAKVAAQGGDGVLTRLSMLALFAIGLLGARSCSWPGSRSASSPRRRSPSSCSSPRPSPSFSRCSATPAGAPLRPGA